MKLLSEIKQAFIMWCNKPTYSREEALEVTLKTIVLKYVAWEGMSREDQMQLLELFPELYRLVGGK